MAKSRSLRIAHPTAPVEKIIFSTDGYEVVQRENCPHVLRHNGQNFYLKPELDTEFTAKFAELQFTTDKIEVIKKFIATCRLQKLIAVLDQFDHSAKSELEKFNVDFARNPATAFEWSYGAFQGAARQYVSRACRESLAGSTHDDERKFLVIIEHAKREVFRGAHNPPRSTSQQSNLMDLAKTEAWAKLLYDMHEYPGY